MQEINDSSKAIAKSLELLHDIIHDVSRSQALDDKTYKNLAIVIDLLENSLVQLTGKM